MTLAYLQTARLNATPLSRHIEAPEQQAPKYASPEEALKAMQADAQQIREKHAGHAVRIVAHDTISDEGILSLLRKHPGMVAFDIAAHFGLRSNSLSTRMTAMVRRKQVMCTWKAHPKGNTKIRSFFAAAIQPKKPRLGTPKRNSINDKILAYIRANQGCTVDDISEHFGITRNAATNGIARIKKFGVTTTRQAGGNHLPGQYWVTE